MNIHIKIPNAYRNTKGIANAIILPTSAGVNSIEITKITKIATFQLSI